MRPLVEEELAADADSRALQQSWSQDLPRTCVLSLTHSFRPSIVHAKEETIQTRSRQCCAQNKTIETSRALAEAAQPLSVR